MIELSICAYNRKKPAKEGAMKKMIDIPFGSSRYDDLVELRYKVLLEPLGLKFLDMHRDKEAGYLHIGCIEDRKSVV